jgi:hypothetical protein
MLPFNVRLVEESSEPGTRRVDRGVAGRRGVETEDPTRVVAADRQIFLKVQDLFRI